MEMPGRRNTRPAEEADRDRQTSEEEDGDPEDRRLFDRDSACHPLLHLKATGIQLSANGAKITCRQRSDRTCRVSFTCKECGLLGEYAKVALKVDEGYVFTATREIRWNVRTEWLQPDQHDLGHIDAYSSVESVVTSGLHDRCMRGEDPSHVRVTLVPTDYRDMLQGLHLYGFVAQFIDARLGSTTSPWEFHRQSCELRSEVELHASHSFYKLVLSQKHTTFDFLTQMLGFLSGMSLISRVCVASWHYLPNSCRKSSRFIYDNPIVWIFSTLLCFWVEKEHAEPQEPANAPTGADAEHGRYNLVATVGSPAESLENGDPGLRHDNSLHQL